jgi:hypothetical protein
MDAGVITLAEYAKLYDSGAPHALKWVQLDRKRGTGGAIEFEQTVCKCSVAETDDSILKFNKIDPATKKNPSHWENKTRNIYIPHNRRIKKIHIYLILEVDGKTMLL